MTIDGEVLAIGVGDTIELPIGPFDVFGDVDTWLDVVDREIGDALVAEAPRPLGESPSLPDAERRPFAVADSD